MSLPFFDTLAVLFGLTLLVAFVLMGLRGNACACTEAQVSEVLASLDEKERQILVQCVQELTAALKQRNAPARTVQEPPTG